MPTHSGGSRRYSENSPDRQRSRESRDRRRSRSRSRSKSAQRRRRRSRSKDSRRRQNSSSDSSSSRSRSRSRERKSRHRRSRSRNRKYSKSRSRSRSRDGYKSAREKRHYSPESKTKFPNSSHGVPPPPTLVGAVGTSLPPIPPPGIFPGRAGHGTGVPPPPPNLTTLPPPPPRVAPPPPGVVPPPPGVALSPRVAPPQLGSGALSLDSGQRGVSGSEGTVKPMMPLKPGPLAKFGQAPGKASGSAGLKMNLGKVNSTSKSKLAQVFNQDSSDDEEEMPEEARIRMRNVGRDTITSSGPNSFGKTRQGFTDTGRLFEKNLWQAMDKVSNDNVDGRSKK
eukprot:TRINITY_DN1551_c0_g1_i2.p1 TRINITY_DN1551_c0_g1~~TRINITY_DN1551_c0_g1_i2.p1  ORF type:complete len:353 (-),score=47.30 TRINITY_DN1551_c0_g1_i2:188-1201(-)